MESGESIESYTSVVGAVYVFNLIVGTGALTMPLAFSQAGWALSLVFLILLAILSYITATFVIEALSIGNAVKQINREKMSLNRGGSLDDSESTPLLSYFEDIRDLSKPRSVFTISQQLEMAHLSQLFLPKIGVFFFYVCVTIYIFGDMTISAVAAPKSVRDVICTYQPSQGMLPMATPVEFPDLELEAPFSNFTPRVSNSTTQYSKCWENSSLRRVDVYWICVAAFFLLLGPFVFFDASKTKYIQMMTTLMRWFAFGIMLVLTAIRLAKGEGRGHPVLFNFKEIPAFFGICIYAFMCHHSLPAMITPIRQKHHVTGMLLINFVVILLFYSALSLTEIFSFDKLADLATLNFQPSHVHPITDVAFFQYFLALFPAFTLSTNFPISGVTLRNNLRKLCSPFTGRLSPLAKRLIFPFVVLIPPLIISMCTENVGLLAQITGGYAGVGIQFLVPTALVFYGRRAIFPLITMNHIQYDPDRFKQIHQSFFSHWIWMLIILISSILIYISVTYKFIADIFGQ